MSFATMVGVFRWIENALQGNLKDPLIPFPRTAKHEVSAQGRSNDRKSLGGEEDAQPPVCLIGSSLRRFLGGIYPIWRAQVVV
jgi:hypothetical protein